MVACPLKDLGCSVEVLRGELDSHLSGASHTSLLLTAVLDLKKQATKADTEIAQAKIEAAAAKAEAKEATEVAKRAIENGERARREAILAKAQVKKIEGLDTTAFSFYSTSADTSTSGHFLCGGVKFHLAMGRADESTKPLCVWLNFDRECVIRLKLQVSSQVESATGGWKVHKTLLDSYEPTLRLRNTEKTKFDHGFYVIKDVKDWPTDSKGKHITNFSVQVLIQKEHTLQFD
jgi:hypothetical protein